MYVVCVCVCADVYSVCVCVCTRYCSYTFMYKRVAVIVQYTNTVLSKKNFFDGALG